MRILFIAGSFPPMRCGVGDYTAHLAKALGARPDATVAVLTEFAASGATRDPHFELFPIAHGWKTSDVLSIGRAIRRWRPDIVNIQYPTQGYGSMRLPFFLPLLARISGGAVVQTWHEYQLRGAITILINGMASAGFVVVRPDYQKIMSPWYRGLANRKPFVFIPNASTIPTVSLTDDEYQAIRSTYAKQGKQLITHFGFASPPKGMDLLFEIADPRKHHLVLVFNLNPEDEYQKAVLRLAQQPDWANSVSITGFLPPEEVGRLLAASDAVILPFRKGGGIWNTSVHAVISQGTFLLTTSIERHGYAERINTYFARPDDLADLRRALLMHAGRRIAPTRVSRWADIAEEHIKLYRKILAGKRGG
jgi:glycosyltransferase involved in cell wall biosynthesis